MAENRIRKIVTAGALSALVIVLGATGLGFIPLPIAAITILQVPVIIGAVLEGPAVGVFIGLLFGIFSIIQASIIGVSPFDLAFLHYPWIAIFPRICIGPAAWLFYALISGSLFRKKPDGAANQKIALWRETVAVAVAGIAGSLANTVLVLTAFALTVPRDFIATARETISNFGTWPWLIGIVSFNGVLEAGFSAAIALAVVLPWKGLSRRSKSRLSS